MEYLSGVVERITFENEDNGFSVVKIKSKGYSDLVTVVGNLAAVNVGAIIRLKGDWKIDSKYGKQFVALDYLETIPATVAAPNSFIHKKERLKWRFIVKDYIKDLQSISVDGKEGKDATDLLEKLYGMLCYACCYYIFNTDNPFRSIGIGQAVLLDLIITRKLGNGLIKNP